MSKKIHAQVYRIISEACAFLFIFKKLNYRC